MKSLIKLAIGVAAFSASSTLALANSALWFNNTNDLGGTSFYVYDQDANDKDLAVGSVTFEGLLFGFAVKFNTGTIIAGGSYPEIDYSFNVISQGAGTILMGYSANGFGTTANPASLHSSIGGTTDGTVEFYATNGNNSLFNWGSPLINNNFGNNTNNYAFSNQDSLNVTVTDPYNLTSWVYVTHQGAGNTSGDSSITVVPDAGMTAVMLGLGLLGLGLAARRNKQA